MTATATAAIPIPDEVRDGFSGSLLRPGDSGYDDVRRVHNGLIDKRPALIARCHTTADVVDAVRIAQGAPEVSVRGGGHNVSGRAVTDGGLMIDLAPMRGVRVHPGEQTIWAQGGATWGEVNRAAHLFGLATTGGVVSSTGVGGLTLGGGEGWLMGRYGLVVDNLLCVELVTASGEVLHVTEDSHPDLFWALRGGGGNFGVATAFSYRAHELQTVVGGLVAHPLEAGRDLGAYYAELTANPPDELTAYFALVPAPDGSGAKLAGIAACHSGPARQAEADLSSLRAFGTPIADTFTTMPYPLMNTMLDEGFPRGALNYWKTATFAEVTEEVVGTLVDAYARCPSPMCEVAVIPYMGAVSRVDPSATAFPHRTRCFSAVIIAQWQDPSETEANIAWARETYEAVRPLMSGGVYVNNLSADDDPVAQGAWGGNYARLVQVKRRYDPGNLFRMNFNIDPNARV